MKVYDKVISTVKPNEVEFDNYHVYVNSNITEATEEDREGIEIDEDITLYSYTTTEYNKDEYIIMARQPNGILSATVE